MIEFLPQNIPRILINRTIVHPSTSAEESGEASFRDNYVFDAYLLGFCDDITRALARQLFADKPPTPIKKEQDVGKGMVEHGGRLLSTVLNGKDTAFPAGNWDNITIPAERVLLFPGALSSKDDSSEEVAYQEIVHCDGCSKRILGTIHKCIDCFDYDLCQTCYPKLSKYHFEGKHSFSHGKQKGK